MKKYKIELTQTIDYYKTITIEATSEKEAREKILEEFTDLTDSNSFDSEIIIEYIKEVL